MHARNLHSDLQSSSTNRAAGPCCASFFQDAHGLRNLPLSWLLPVHLPMVARGTDACVESQEVNLCLWPEADRPMCCDTDDCGLLQFFPQPDELLICFNSAGFSEFQLPVPVVPGLLEPTLGSSRASEGRPRSSKASAPGELRIW